MHRRASRSLECQHKPMPRCSPRGSGCFALAQDLGRSPEAGIPRTVRVKPSEIGLLFLQQGNQSTCRRPAQVSEWVAHRLNSKSSSTTRPNARPPPCYRRYGKTYLHSISSRLRDGIQFAGDEGKQLSLGIQGIFLPGILPDHLRDPHNSILIHPFQAIWSFWPAMKSSLWIAYP
jgi:hypothetical protein